MAAPVSHPQIVWHAVISERNSAKSMQLEGVLQLHIETALSEIGGISIRRI